MSIGGDALSTAPEQAQAGQDVGRAISPSVQRPVPAGQLTYEVPAARETAEPDSHGHATASRQALGQLKMGGGGGGKAADDDNPGRERKAAIGGDPGREDLQGGLLQWWKPSPQPDAERRKCKTKKQRNKKAMQEVKARLEAERVPRHASITRFCVPLPKSPGPAFASLPAEERIESAKVHSSDTPCLLTLPCATLAPAFMHRNIPQKMFEKFSLNRRESFHKLLTDPAGITYDKIIRGH